MGVGRLRESVAKTGRISPVWRPGLNLLSILILIVTFFLSPAKLVTASEPSRRYSRTSVVPADHWAVVRWNNQSRVCDFYLKQIEGGSYPSSEDIKNHCGEDVYREWIQTGVCVDALSGNPAGCKGLALHFLGSEKASVKEFFEYPPAKVRIEFTPCVPWIWCDTRPMVKIIGEEPLGEHYITAVYGRIGGQDRSCEGSSCELRLPVTDSSVVLEYWALSSFGDESQHQFIKLRNRIPSSPPEKFLLEIISPDYRHKMPAGMEKWGIFPAIQSPIGKILEQPSDFTELSTHHAYQLLAGYLIRSGKVNAGSCTGGALLSNGNANPCGQQVSQNAVNEWQNRFDLPIYLAARSNQVPARLIKGLIGRETQFWPDHGSPYELGLGRITQNGADLVLSWNQDYFQKICRPLYGKWGCAAGYLRLSVDHKTILRWRVLAVIGTSAEMDLIAATLYASSQQVAQMVVNVTGQLVASTMTLEDMWLLSVANYHAGSGCVGNALQLTANANLPLTWGQISKGLEPGCRGAVEYVDQVKLFAQ